MPRPRSDEARRRAMVTAAELIVERGVASLSIEEVAARSGVAKTTIYRHWPERTSLIIDTVNAQFEHVGTPDTGTLRGDLEAFFAAASRADLSGAVGRIMSCLIEAASRDSEMGILLDRISSDRERVIRTLVQRAADRGELDERAAQMPIDALVGVLAGPMVFQKLVRRRPLTGEYVGACLDVVLAGLIGARPATALSSA